MIIKDKGSAIKAYEELIETDLKIDMVNAQTKGDEFLNHLRQIRKPK